MNTPAHLIMGAAAFGRPDDRRVTWAALAGGFAPDLSLYLMVAVSTTMMGIPAERVFRVLYYSDAWQSVFAVDNSFVLWGIGLAVALWTRRRWAVALTGAALLHLAFDFPLHTHDARMHFWPLSEWKFISPISYWDGSRGGDWVGMAETGMVAVLTVWLLWRFRDPGLRAVFALLALAQLAPMLIWRLVF
ncbi:cobalamin biosynthesis protein CobQ [Rhodobacteraceae bacterium CCMM004]|nr:cobalamin biosynthesis protein CobQ [Rhodobacteraceae bacterium CCMM004]